jgi:hypothetical protein
MRDILNDMPSYIDTLPTYQKHLADKKRKMEEEEYKLKEQEEFARTGFTTCEPIASDNEYEPQVEEHEEGEVVDVKTSETESQTRGVTHQIKATEMKNSGLFKSAKEFPSGAKCTTTHRLPKVAPVQQLPRKRTAEEIYGPAPIIKNRPRPNPKYRLSSNYFEVNDRTRNGAKSCQRISVHQLYDTTGVLRWHMHDDEEVIIKRYIYWMDIRGKDIRRSDPKGATRSWSTFLNHYNQGASEFRDRMKRAYDQQKRSRPNAVLPLPPAAMGKAMENYDIDVDDLPVPIGWRNVDLTICQNQPDPGSVQDHQATVSSSRDKRKKRTSRKKSPSKEVYDSDEWSPSLVDSGDESEPSSHERTGSLGQERPESERQAAPKSEKDSPATSPRSLVSPSDSVSSTVAQQYNVPSLANQQVEEELSAVKEKLEHLEFLQNQFEKLCSQIYVKHSFLDSEDFVPRWVLERDYVSYAFHQKALADMTRRVDTLESLLKIQTMCLENLQKSVQDKVSDDQRKTSDEASS